LRDRSSCDKALVVVRTRCGLTVKKRKKKRRKKEKETYARLDDIVPCTIALLEKRARCYYGRGRRDMIGA